MKIRTVKWKEKAIDLENALSNHSDKNYLKIILENYFLYNAYSREEIALILYEKFKEIVKNHPDYFALQKNIFLEIFSKFIQVSEDLALLGRVILLTSDQVSTVDIYMNSANKDILNYYREAYKGFGDKQLIKLMGIDKLKHYINSTHNLTTEEIKNYNYIIKKSIETEKDNLKKLAKLYIEEFEDEKGNKLLKQAGSIDVYNSIKHGFKLVQPTKLTKLVWQDIKDDSIDVMHQIIVDESTGQKIIALGGFGTINMEVIESVMYNLKYYSEEIHHICEMKLWSEKDPMYIIKRFRLNKAEIELKKRKVKPNEKCPCGSEIKYKKCCYYFKYELSNKDPYSVVDY